MVGHYRPQPSIKEVFRLQVKKNSRGEGGVEISINKDFREEIEVEADTLQAVLSPTRAVLSQKEAKPFTIKDVELRDKVLKIYPRNRQTPFPPGSLAWNQGSRRSEITYLDLSDSQARMWRN